MLTQAARVVVTWLNKAREAEEKRKRADAEPLAPEGDDGNGGDNPEGNGTEDDEDDEDQEEFVYDIQVGMKNLQPRNYGGCIHIIRSIHRSIYMPKPFVMLTLVYSNFK